MKYKPKSYADGGGVYQKICYNPLADKETIGEVEATIQPVLVDP